MGTCSKNNKKNNKIDKIKKFHFETNNHFVREITMNCDKTIVELIIGYYKNINRFDLIEDDRINFSYNGKKIFRDQTDLIKEYFKDNEDYYIIHVSDNDNLISKPKKIFKINFQPTNQQNKAEINIESDKTLKELILEYFKKINRLDLFGDKEIYFLFWGKNISLDQKDLVDQHFKENQENQIIVVDNEDKFINKEIKYNEQMSQNMIKVKFCSSTGDIIIKIDKRKTLKESIKNYFNKINRPELFGDDNILFLCSGKSILHDSNDLIESFMNRYQDGISICVHVIDDRLELNRLRYDNY